MNQNYYKQEVNCQKQFSNNSSLNLQPRFCQKSSFSQEKLSTKFSNIHEKEAITTNQKNNNQFALKTIAFENFEKSKVSLNPKEDIHITICDNNYKIINSQSCDNVSKKSVSFDLQKNSLQYIERDRYDTHNLPQQNTKLISNSATLGFDDVDDDDLEDDYSICSNDICVIVEKNDNIKGILKQHPKIQGTENKLNNIDIIVMNEEENASMLSPPEKQNLENKVTEYQYGVGLKYLKKYGFECGFGLGSRKQGILEPVEAIEKYTIGENDEPSLLLEENQCKKKTKIEIIDFSDEDLKITEQIQSSDQKKETFEKPEQVEEKLSTQEFKNYLMYLNQDEVVFIQNGLDYGDYYKFQECFVKFKREFLEYNLIGLLITKIESKIKLAVGSWSGPKMAGDLMTRELAIINKIIHFTKSVLVEKRAAQNIKNQSISKNDFFTLQKYIETLVNPILGKLKVYLMNYFNPIIENKLQEFMGIWSETKILIYVELEKCPQTIPLFNTKAIEDIEKTISTLLTERMIKVNFETLKSSQIDMFISWLEQFKLIKNLKQKLAEQLSKISKSSGSHQQLQSLLIVLSKVQKQEVQLTNIKEKLKIK